MKLAQKVMESVLRVKPRHVLIQSQVQCKIIMSKIIPLQYNLQYIESE